MPGLLDFMLRPRSIAVIGASARPNALGGRVTARLLQTGYKGQVYLVNPKPDPILGLPTYPSVSAVPGPVDMALVIVPRDAVIPTAQECCRAGVRGLVVITAGFREVDEEGRQLEEELVALCRAQGVRMIGPNCMGVVNTNPALSMDATFSPTPALAGPIGFISQSGALGVAVLNICHERNIGFSQFVSMGNKADIGENELLEAWEEDPEVPVITLYLESFKDPARFLDIARRVSRRKPVVVVKAGRTAAGARAASSHTGALAGADSGAEALLKQAGVVRVDGVEEMLDDAMVFSRCPLPGGPRVAVLTNAGGPGILAADALDMKGLVIATLLDETQRKLRAILPREAAVGNPVDMIASAGPEQYGACLDLLLADPNVDAVVPVVVSPPAWDAVDVLASLKEVTGRHSKPVLTVFMVGNDLKRLAQIPDPPPVFRLPEAAAKALADVLAYAKWRETPEGPVLSSCGDNREIAAFLQPTLDQGGGYLPPEATFQVLAAAGLPIAPWRTASGAALVSRAASEIGFPVVLKAVAPALVHKSDVGGVALNLKSHEELSQALSKMEQALGRAGWAPGSWSYLIQAFRPGGREVIVGATRDPGYGPLVMFGLGGKYVEVFRDVQFGITPLGRTEAERMVQSIRGLPLLTGTRGEEGVALDPAISALERIARLCQDHPEIKELDVNPLLLYPGPGEAAVVDARIRVEL